MKCVRVQGYIQKSCGESLASWYPNTYKSAKSIRFENNRSLRVDGRGPDVECTQPHPRKESTECFIEVRMLHSGEDGNLSFCEYCILHWPGVPSASPLLTTTIHMTHISTKELYGSIFTYHVTTSSKQLNQLFTLKNSVTVHLDNRGDELGSKVKGNVANN